MTLLTALAENLANRFTASYGEWEAMYEVSDTFHIQHKLHTAYFILHMRKESEASYFCVYMFMYVYIYKYVYMHIFVVCRYGSR